MSLSLKLSDLTSRAARELITADSTIPGFREIVKDTADRTETSGGILSKITNLFGDTVSLSGWIIGKVIQPIGLTFVNLFQNIVRGVSFIYNFNWNISDSRLDERIDILKLVIAGQLGETFGNAAGYLICGVLPSAAMIAVNEQLGLYLLQNVGEEALDEFSDNVVALIRLTFRAAASGLAYTVFKSHRKAVKALVSTKNPRSRKFAEQIFGAKGVKAIEAWGEDNSSPWSLRLFVEREVEDIDNEFTQEFVEEFTEEFADSCVEAGYVVAQSLDTWVLEQKQARDVQQEQETLVELIPNREIPGESVILQGDRREIQTQTLTTLNTYNLIEARDIGTFVGENIVDTVKKPPKETYIKILLRGAPMPPWRDGTGKVSKRTQIQIPCVNKADLKWKDIKQAVGGSQGYLWGRFNVKATLEDKNLIEFFAASEAEGERILEKLLKLASSDLATLNILEEKKEGARKKYDKLYKETTRVYPAFVVVKNELQLLTRDEGRATVKGHRDHREMKIPLYTSDKPDNYQELIDSLFVKDRTIA